MRTCREVAARLSVGLDDPLPLGERMALRFHMMMCGACSRYNRQLHFMKDVTHEIAEEEPAGAEPKLRLPAESRSRLDAAMADELQRKGT